jgi:histone deacetylase complex regulatory component SIN3
MCSVHRYIQYFVVSEFSFALSKNLYSHTETPLGKIIGIVTYNAEDKIKEAESKKALEKHLGHEITVDYKSKEEGYWQFVKTVMLIIFVPYFLSFYRLYYVLRYKST